MDSAYVNVLQNLRELTNVSLGVIPLICQHSVAVNPNFNPATIVATTNVNINLDAAR